MATPWGVLGLDGSVTEVPETLSLNRYRNWPPLFFWDHRPKASLGQEIA
ncbi:MAG: hypothetical protein R3C44_07770 [Chloroflexota bacterium]